MNKGFAIAIDGPVASGKGTLAPNLAKELNGFYLDTGAMYRCVALYILENNIDPNNKEKVERVAQEIDIDFRDGKTYLNGEDVSSKIRTAEISRVVPLAVGYEGVRKQLIAKQREIAKRNMDEGKTVIVEGRDIATIVLPDAKFKFYLTANVEERAKRRHLQMKVLGEEIYYETVLEDVRERDKRDIEVNKTLVSDPEGFGYQILDNTGYSEEETLNKAIEMLKEKGLYDSH
jgi:CMP/dCMP kinase